ncbi:caffeyl-CoA reductase-Etf complex subunit CarE [Clostridiales bacterium]|nr:caffeyl-CoA reductase-Etf complex subunit CarE [Clostridiales bacterium]
MNKSKVYFTDFRTRGGMSLPQKLDRLVRAAGIENIDFKKKFAAIKIHFGEPGNLAYLRPNYAKVISDIVKEKGGYPFLTDCNTLYVGRRKNALEHIDAAYENGFSPFSTGCNVIIGDGLKGLSEEYVPVRNGELCKQAIIGKEIMEADIIISLTHFKGHEVTGFGGALKNIGMGSGSRAGKMDMHSSSGPRVKTSKCVGCGSCAKNCAHDAISIVDKKAVIDTEKCAGCGRCIGSCPFDAMASVNNNSSEITNKKIAEYSMAVLDGRPNFHISIVNNVSPFCDCHSENDVPIVPDVGMFASFDPVALDVACADAVNAQPMIPNSVLSERDCCHNDHFMDTHPVTDWRFCVEHAEKIGLGSREYELIEI